MANRVAVILVLAAVAQLSSCGKKQQAPVQPVAPAAGTGSADAATGKEAPEVAAADAKKQAAGPADLSNLMVEQKDGWQGGCDATGCFFEKILPHDTSVGLFDVEIMPPDKPQGVEDYAAMLLQEYDKSYYNGFYSIEVKKELPDGWIIKGNKEVTPEPEEPPPSGLGFVIMRRIGAITVLCFSEEPFDDKAVFDEAVDLCLKARFEAKPPAAK